jgi:5-methylcytosine-specific restriction protein A
MGRLTTIKPRVQPLGQVAKGPWSHARPSRHDRGYGSEWVRTVKRIRARDHDLCQECKRRADGVLGMYGAIDHKVPKVEGGTDDDSNLEVICNPCHAVKTEAERKRGLGQA